MFVSWSSSWSVCFFDHEQEQVTWLVASWSLAVHIMWPCGFRVCLEIESESLEFMRISSVLYRHVMTCL